jgi:PPP family 3-phenylpropionic acid transporter
VKRFPVYSPTQDIIPPIVNRLPVILHRPVSIIRLFFFLWFAGGSFLQPYLPIFYRGQGLSGLQIGMLSSIGFAVAIFAAPQWGRWNDRAAAPQRILQFAILMNVVTMLILSRQTAFLPMVLVIMGNALFASATEPAAASLALRATRGTGSGFGSVRVWGSLGWSIMVLVSGWWIERSSIQTSFAGFAIFMLAALSILFLFRSGGKPTPASPPVGPSSPRPPSRSMGALRGDPSVTSISSHPAEYASLDARQEPAAVTSDPSIPNRQRLIPALFLAMMMSWIAVAGVRQFEPLFIKQLGAGEQMIGFSAMLSALVELPGMFWADSLTRKHGARRVLIAGMILDGVLRGSILLWPSIPAIVAVRALIGISFSMITVGVVAYVQEHTPHEHQTRAVALYTVVVRNMVFLVVYPLSGVIFDAVGAYWLYAIALAGNVTGGLILWLANPPRHSSRVKNISQAQ